MQTIGERLEEARRRKGISIRDAAEATKIRGDFLSSFENNSFETINLPEIYVRGFLKSYARFLKLDTDKIMTDYEAAKMGHPKSSRGGGRDLGGLSIGGRYEESESSHGGSAQTPKRVIPPQAVEAYDEDGDEDSASRMEKQLYYKIGLICGSVFLGVLLLVLIINLFSGDDEVVDNPPAQNTPVAQQTTGGTTNNAAPTRETVTFRATGNTAVQVYELHPNGNRTMLGGRQLTEGDSFQVTRDPVNELLVEFTSGANLRIETTTLRSDFSNYENYGRARIPASRR